MKTVTRMASHVHELIEIAPSVYAWLQHPSAHGYPSSKTRSFQYPMELMRSSFQTSAKRDSNCRRRRIGLP